MGAAKFDGLRGGGFIDHETGGGQHAFAMSANDRLVDTGRTAEIVGVDNQPADRLFCRGPSLHWSEPRMRGSESGCNDRSRSETLVNRTS